MQLRLFLFAGWLACPASSIAHQDDHPSQSGNTHNVFLDMKTVESLGLEKPPRRNAMFKLRLTETGEVNECTPRFQMKDAAFSAELCARLERAISWGQELRRDGRKLVKNQSVQLVWPKRSSREYLSNFGGALPMGMTGWIHNSEIHKLNGYDTGETDFEIGLEISEQGRSVSCSIATGSVPEGFDDLLCDQINSHSFWVPKIDSAGDRVKTRATISARLIMTSRGCRGSLAIEMDHRHGRMEIVSGGRFSSCGNIAF